MRSSKLGQKYKVGDVVAGQELIAIIEEAGNTHAVSKCLICGKETKSNMQRLVSERACKCQQASAMVEKAKDRKETTNSRIAIGQIIEGREVISLFKNKHGKSAVKVRCTNIMCQMVTDVTVSELTKNPHACSCQGFQLAQKALLESHGVEHMAHSKELMQKALLTRISNDIDSQYRSKGELSLQEYINDIGLQTKHTSVGGKEVDILIEDLSIGIEFNGVYWHSEEVMKDTQAHLKKKNIFKQNGVDLIQIWEHLWLNRNLQVKNYLHSRLGKNSKRVGARKCEIGLIDNETAREFVNEYHIQKMSIFEFAIGATYDGELIAVAVFGKHHRGSGENVLSRLCSKFDWTCSGFLGKAVKTAYEILKEPIFTWVDRCLSEGESYIKAGFKQDEIQKPDYFYASVRKGVVSKQCFRKVDDRTESERAKDEGLNKIWDCGKIRFVYVG